MLLAASRNMPLEERAICTKYMVQGFRDACQEVEAPITGGQTVLNPWPIIGGVATSVVAQDEFIDCNRAQVGDCVLLTKPLGTQIAVNVHQWRHEHSQPHKKNCTQSNLWTKCQENPIHLTEETADRMMHEAVSSMCRLNRNGAKLLLKYGAHACTDVTGFGILGHAQNLSENQVEPVGIEIHTLPCIEGSPAVNNHVFDFQLIKGYSAETSGGLMVCIEESKAQAFMTELQELDGGAESWIIGRVVENPERQSTIRPDVTILEV
jgi:selenide,water dikinase